MLCRILYKSVAAFLCAAFTFTVTSAGITAAVVAASALFVSCAENDGSGYTFKYDIDSNPRTLDPQTATGKESALVITNLFEGLLQLDENGVIIAGVAGEYEVSADGLTYIFHLRGDVYWDIKKGDDYVVCDADDFVFAFRRLFSPLMKSPNAASYFCVKNAEAAYNKKVDITEVGVTAPDKTTVIITLEYPNPNLPVLLTEPPAMPCNEEFYAGTKGRYGLSDTSLAGNGAFRLYSWYYDPHSNVDNHFILRRNEPNAAVTPVYPRGLNFFIDDTDSLENFVNGVSNSIVADSDNADVLIKHGYPYTAYENAVWGIKFNPSGKFADKNIWTALAQTIDRTGAGSDGDLQHSGVRDAATLIPDIIRVGNSFYHDGVSSENYIKYDPAASKANFGAVDAGGTGDDDIITIIAPEDTVAADYLARVTQQWQENLGFFCKVKSLPSGEYDAAVAAGDYDIALVEYTAEWNSPSAIMRGITAGYDDKEIAEMLTAAERAANVGDSLAQYKKAEKAIVQTAIFIPLYFKTEYFFTDKKSSGIEYNPFSKTITYRNAKNS